MPDDGPDNLPRAGKPAPSTGRLIAVSLVALALMIRMAPLFITGEGWPSLAGEARAYLDLGRSVAAGKGLQRPAAYASGAGVADVMPGYPLVVAAADWSGRDMRALVALQALAGAAALVLALGMGHRLGGLWAGAVAAALLVFDPLQVVYCDRVSPQVMLGLALVAMAAAGLKFIQAEESGGRRPWLWAAAAGAALAVAVYLDWTVLGLVVVAGLAALVAAVIKKRWRLLRGWAIGLAVVVVCLAPWVVRNDVVLGRPVLVTSAGLRLLDGFWPDSNDPQDMALQQKLADENLPRDEIGLDRHCFSLAVERIGQRPGQWLGRMVRHAADMWAPATPTSGPVVGPGIVLPPIVGYASLVPAAILALAGLWVLRRRPAVLVWLLLVPVGLTLAHAPFAAGPADRIAAMPLVAVLGGIGLAAVLGPRPAPGR